MNIRKRKLQISNNNRRVRQNGFNRIYNRLLADWAMVGVVILVFMVFSQMQEKHYVRGRQDKTNCCENKQYLSVIFSHFQNFMNRNTMNINLRFQPAAYEPQIPFSVLLSMVEMNLSNKMFRHN
jgi:hypothetical protein